HGLRNAVDVDELLDQLFAAFLVVAASAAIVTPAAPATAALAAPTATAAARSTLALLFLGRSGLDRRLDGFGLVRLLFVLHSSQLQAAFAGSVGEGLHPAMEQEAATVEHDARHAGLLRPLRERLADGRSAVLGRAGLGLEILVEARGGSQRPPRSI